MEGARGRRCFCVSKAKAPDPAAAELVGLRQGELSQRARAAAIVLRREEQIDATAEQLRSC